MTPTIKVAVIGAGRMAREHLRAFRDIPGVHLVGICSRTRKRAEDVAKEFNVAEVSDSVKELYRKTSPHLVVVAVSVVSMSAVSRACFEFPWTILLEKPPGYALSEAVQIQKWAEDKKRKVFIGLNRRFLSSTRTVQSDLAGDKDLRFIHVQDRQNMQEATSYGHPDLVVENLMFGNSIHVIDYLRIFGRGKITSIKPILKWNAKTSNVVIATVTFDSGDMGLYEGVWRGPGPWAVKVITPNKHWVMQPLEQAAYYLVGQKNPNTIPLHLWDQQFKPGFRLQAEEVIAATLGQPTDVPTLNDAVETMKLIAGIFKKKH